jgi:hypothetical protein
MHARNLRFIAGMSLASFALVACGRKDTETTIDSAAAAPATPAPTMTPTVTVIETGKSVGANMRVTESTTTFGKNDSIYLTVVTDNAPATSTLTAKWTFQDGQVVDSTTQAVAPAQAGGMTSVTQFHITKPGGWPVGTYTVEILLDGRSVGTRTVEVK